MYHKFKEFMARESMEEPYEYDYKKEHSSRPMYKAVKMGDTHFSMQEAEHIVAEMYHYDGSRKYVGEKYSIMKAKEVAEKIYDYIVKFADYGFNKAHSVAYAKLSYQTAYTMQKGVAEWDSGTTYYTGDFCKGVGEGKLYVSLVDNNLNHVVSDTTYWEEFSSGAFRNIGEIVTSTIPLTDAGLHLLDGALINYGSYSAFVDYIADLYDSGDYTAIFDTEANWQATVTLTGVCDKFVYDSVNNTVRLPKYGNQIFTKSPSGTVPVVGNGMTLGLTNGTNLVGLNSSAVQTNRDMFTTDAYNVNVTTSTSSATGVLGKLGVTTDGSKSGLIADLSNITNYPLDCYYYVVIATSTKTQIQVDIDEIATDLNGKMDTDGTNASSSVKFADGQWVSSHTDIASSVTAKSDTGVLEYSLATYLPDDNYDYEVIFTAWGNGSSASSGAYCWLFTDLVGEKTSSAIYAAHVFRGNGTAEAGGAVILPVGTGRKLKMYCSNTSNATIAGIRAIAYRRIGTNQ